MLTITGGIVTRALTTGATAAAGVGAAPAARGGGAITTGGVVIVALGEDVALITRPDLGVVVSQDVVTLRRHEVALSGVIRSTVIIATRLAAAVAVASGGVVVVAPSENVRL